MPGRYISGITYGQPMRLIYHSCSTLSQLGSRRPLEVDGFQPTGELFCPDPITLIIEAPGLTGGWAAPHTHTPAEHTVCSGITHSQSRTIYMYRATMPRACVACHLHQLALTYR